MDAKEWLPTAATATGISEQCKYHAFMTLDHIIKLSPWPFKMIDSTSKIPESVMDGNLIDFGNYEECLDIDVKEDWGNFLGQHCVAMFEIPVDSLPHVKALEHVKTPVLPLGFSICTPSTCNASDVQSALSLLGKYVVVDPLLCHTKESPPLQSSEWFAIAILTIIGLMCFCSTMYDLLILDKEKRNKWALLFSWYTNGKSLFSVEPSPDSFRTLHGVKVLSIMLIVVGHVALLSKGQPTINYLHYIKRMKNVEYLVLTNAPFAVDTFFIICGLLVTYIFMKAMDTGYRFNVPIYYLHRIVRVTPVLAVVVLINATILTRLSDGPLWDFFIAKTEGKYCSQYWWSTLLYIQNYVNTQENCVLTSWFLAVDMQMYFLSPIFLLALYKRPKIGYMLLGGATALGMIISFVETFVNKDDPNNTKPTIKFSSRYYYTHSRYISWVAGIAGGYLMYKTIDWRNKVKSGTEIFPKRYLISGWVLFTILSLTVVFAMYPFQKEDYVYSAVEASFYFAFTRPLWSLCILWLIFACESGCGGIVYKFLSWPGFIPMAHLTFCIYLIHFDIIIAQIFSAKVPAFSDDFHVGGKCLDVLFLSALSAIVLSLSIEAPCIAFMKLLFNKGSESRSSNFGYVKHID